MTQVPLVLRLYRPLVSIFDGSHLCPCVRDLTLHFDVFRGFLLYGFHSALRDEVNYIVEPLAPERIRG